MHCHKTKQLFWISSVLTIIVLTIPTVKATYLINNNLNASIGMLASSTSKNQINDNSKTTATNTTINTNKLSNASTSNNSSTPGTSISNESINSSDLGVSNPTILPNSHFYFLKNWWREIRLFFTFNPIAKIELENKFANEKLIEVKKLTQKVKNPVIINKALKNYKDSINKIKQQTQKIEQKKINNQQLNKFLDKFTRQQILHQAILDRLENKVPPIVSQKIKDIKKNNLEIFKDVITRLGNNQKIPQRMEEAVKRIHKIHFPELKALQMIKKIEGNASSTNIRNEFYKAEEKIIQHLKTKIQNANLKQRKIFEKIIKSGKNKYNSLQVIEKLKNENIPTSTREFLNQVKSRVIKQIIEKGNARIEKIEKKFIPVKIKNILENPQEWINKKVKINGKIVLSKKIAEQKPTRIHFNYYLSDGTGKIGIIGHLPHPTINLPNNQEDKKCVSEGGNLGPTIQNNNLKCCPNLIAFIPYRILGVRGYCINPNHSLTVLGEVKSNKLLKSKSKINNNFSPYIITFYSRWDRINIHNQPKRQLTKKYKKQLLNRLLISTKPTKRRKTCKNLCGDGICQKMVCLTIGCPCSETIKSCPQDCQENNISTTSTTTRKTKIEQKYENFLHRHFRMPNEQK